MVTTKKLHTTFLKGLVCSFFVMDKMKKLENHLNP
jgi:hypothetical protein